MGYRILCFGDSNTYGYDPRSYLGGRYPASVRWTALLKTAGWEITNAGENGRCIPHRAQEAGMLVEMVRRAKADMAVIMLGSNDLLQPSAAASAEACAERMERFLTASLQEMPAPCEILLIAPPPMEWGAWVNDPEILEESRRLADCYEALAQRLGILFADAGTWDVELTFDGVHFSELGHRAFAAGMQRILKRILPPEAGCQHRLGDLDAYRS